METTEMVSRVVEQARRNARADSEIDEQAWFDAGEPDTVPNVPRVPTSHLTERAGPPLWLLLLGATVTAWLGYTLGFHLGRG